VEDVEDIKSFIKRGSPRYAQMVAERIVEAAERLREFPKSGRVVPEFGRDDVREVLWGNYRIVHRVGESHADILTVYHGARLLRLTDK
jgi:plasmid stabilization system protein ParE